MIYDLSVFISSRFPVICGIKHSGKSTCGQLAAEITGLPFRDMDTEIEHIYKTRYATAASCREIYRNNGAAVFQALETEAAAAVAAQKPTITAAGGGLCDNPQAWNILTKAGAFFIYLDEPEERLYQRITDGGLPPFLANGDPKTLFRDLYQKRSAFYKTHCHAILPPDFPEPSPEERTKKMLSVLMTAASGDFT